MIQSKTISTTISDDNFKKIKAIQKENPKQSISSIVNSCIEMSLEEIKDLIKNPLDYEEHLLKLKLNDIQKMKQKSVKNILAQDLPQYKSPKTSNGAIIDNHKKMGVQKV